MSSREETVTIASVPASVAVIGGGRMGAGIAQVFAAKGAAVAIVESDAGTAAAASPAPAAYAPHRPPPMV